MQIDFFSSSTHDTISDPLAHHGISDGVYTIQKPEK